jgi:CBS domain-containing protein
MNEPVTRILDQKTEPLEAISPRTSITDAITRMNDRHIGSVLVMDGDRLVGIFTERDVLTRVVPNHLDADSIPVAEVMTRQPITIGPGTTVEEAMMVISDTRRRHLPVVQGGRVLGMISIGDLTRFMVRDQKRTIDDLIDYVQRV